MDKLKLKDTLDNFVEQGELRMLITAIQTHGKEILNLPKYLEVLQENSHKMNERDKEKVVELNRMYQPEIKGYNPRNNDD